MTEWTFTEWSALAAIVLSVATLVWTATRVRSEVAYTSTKTAGELVEQVRGLVTDVKELRDANEELEVRVDQLQREVRVYEFGVSRLAEQLTMLGHEPVWTPPPRQEGR